VVIRQRAEAARARQKERFKDNGLFCSADMGPSEVRESCQLDETGRRLMKSAMTQMSLGARAFHRVLKIGRNIADLSGDEDIQPAHLAEAKVAAIEMTCASISRDQDKKELPAGRSDPL